MKLRRWLRDWLEVILAERLAAWGVPGVPVRVDIASTVKSSLSLGAMSSGCGRGGGMAGWPGEASNREVEAQEGHPPGDES